MTEPQVWTMIGVFTALMFGMLTTVSTLFVRVIRTEIGGLRGELMGEIGGLQGQMGGLRGELIGEIGGLQGQMGGLRAEMNARFEAVDARFDAMNSKIDGLDRDVQLLMRREFGIDRE